MDAEAHLLSVLAAHDSPLGPEDVSWSFSTPKTADAVSEYVQRYLRPATLLSLEEQQIVQHLQRNGRWKKLAPAAVAKTEEELAAEADELDASTALLHAHAEELKRQAATLEAMRSRKRAERERRKKLEAARRRKWAGEKDEMVVARDDLLGILREEVRDLRDTVGDHQAEAEELERILDGDDRVLTRLERMAAGLVVEDEEGEEGGVVQRVEALVEQLATLETKAIKNRLDRVFLENCAPGQPLGEEERELQEELDLLYKEIPTVAKGAAYNEFLAPLLTSMAAAAKGRGENWVLGGKYICDVLEHLRGRLAAIASLLSSCHDRDAAVMTLIATIDREADAFPSSQQRPSTPPPADQPKRLGSPVRFAESNANKLGRIPFLTPARRRGRSMDFSKESYPELALLSHVGIALPPTSPTRMGASPPPPALTDSFLDGQVAATAAKVAHVSELPQGTWEAVRAEAAAVARVLREALWSENEYEVTQAGVGAMAVVREEVRRGVVEVDNGVNEVGTALKKLLGRVEEMDREHGDVGGEGRKEEFVARWGR